MPQKFITQLEQVCRSHRRRRRLAATCWALVAMAVATLVLVGLDYALGIADVIGRTLLTATLVLACALVARRWLRAVFDDRVTPLQIAHAAERRHPQLRDVVTSAWDFSQQTGEDPTSGSESLRRAVVLRATTAVDDVDWQQLVPRRPLQKSAVALAGMVVAMSLFGWLSPQATRVGLLRLVNPWNAAEWPRRHDLQFIEPPALLSADADLVLQLRDTRGALPGSVTMHYRARRQGRWHEETQVLAATSDPLEVRRPSVQQSLQYRATGGDHRTMPWQSLEVVVAPHVLALQVTVHPPAYTMLVPHTWDQTSPIWAGSDLELQGRTDRPVRQVLLRGKRGTQLAAQVSSDGLSFRVEPSAWQIAKSETFRVELMTARGLTTPDADHLELEVVADQPPQVRFVEPTSDVTVLPTVAVPLVVEATDEFAVREIELVFRRADRSDEGDQRLSLWPMPGDRASEDLARRQRVEFLWQLAPLSLEPGCVVEVQARASDNQPATGHAVRALQLHIVSEAQLWQEIVARRAELVETLAQLLRAQRELRDTTADWVEFPGWSTARWASASQAALFQQRQVSRALADGPQSVVEQFAEQSVVEQLAELSRTIERNGLFRPEATDRLQTAEALLQNLVDVPLAAVEQSLREVARQSQRSLDRETLHPLFVATVEQQEQVVTGLRRAVDLLMPGNLLGRLERELAAIHTDQAALTEHCRVEVAPQSLQSDQVTPAEPEPLAGAVRRQRELARRLAELMLDVTQGAERLADDEPTFAARLAATVTLGEELGLQATIAAAADQLARRRLGRAATLQLQTLDDLAKLLARLAGRDAESAAARFESLQKAQRRRQHVALARLQMARLDTTLSAFIGRQRAVLQEIVRLESIGEEAVPLQETQRESLRQLTDRQGELRREVTSQADELTSLPVFGHLLRQASESMQAVESRLQKIELGQPTHDLAKQAVDQLTQLAAAVRQERRNLAANNRGGNGGGEGESGDTAQAQTLQLILGQLELLKSLQAVLHEKTTALETEQATGPPPSQSRSELARRQQQLAELASRLTVEPFDSLPEKRFPNLEQE